MKWYDVNKTLSYNCLFNFIIGSRGCGKTYALKKKAVKNFLDKGQQFVYLRRYKEELDETAESYFNDIILNGEFNDCVIEYRSGKYFINDRVAGYAMSLTKAKDYKSIAYPEVYLIIFDEFLIEDNGYARYLKNEVKQFLNFYMSIDRYRGCIAFFLANSVSIINPYTLYFNLNMPYGSNIVRKNDCLLELVQNEEYINDRKNTRFGKLIEGTDFAEYAIDNKFMDDSTVFIKRKTEKAQYYFTFLYMGETYGVWLDRKQGELFISDNIDNSCKFIYSLTKDDHKPNTYLLSAIGSDPFWKTLINNYKMGNVFCENQRLCAVMRDIVKLFICR